jgi:hypothetical protein
VVQLQAEVDFIIGKCSAGGGWVDEKRERGGGGGGMGGGREREMRGEKGREKYHGC